MSNQLNLKELERKAFRSTYQDGLWDVYLGLIVIWMALFLFHPEGGYQGWNTVWMMVGYASSYALFWAGKKYVTLPRMGRVTFGPLRRRKKATLAFVLGAVIAVQVVIVLLSAVGRNNAELGASLSAFFGGGSMEHVLVATVASLFVGPSMILIAYFTDFTRGYYIAILMALAVFLMILLNQPIYAIIIGVLIAIPGVVLFVRFLRQYPLPREEAGHE